MKLKFTDEYLEHLGNYAKSIDQDKNFLIESIHKAVKEASRFEICMALTTGAFMPEKPDLLFYSAGCGFALELNLKTIIRPFTVNWDEYWNFRYEQSEKEKYGKSKSTDI